ncbi:MAG: gliding motility-associated C-terminal domain-containing protein [Flammeovirgaceae bacterium]|nr:gliding motility-associated C-terminal domain-containing protein [Flammeovirgaceae bacterium]
MRRLLFILMLCTPFCGKASHIVGGEFELLHINGNLYRLNLILYFDKINGTPGAKDNGVNVSFFQKKDNLLVMSQFLPLLSEENVGYTQPECSQGFIQTDKLIYTAEFILDPEIFDDPEGYYVSWQRCCRNYTITNIFSANPASGGNSAGQTFYLEFPPVVKEGVPFINSSPRLFPPLNDYACPFKPYYVDFAGVDDDGDSLVYTMVTPLNTHAAVALPPPIPAAPYPPVLWRQGYGLNNVINGLPDLRISKSGLLTATPRNQGLFVFAVKIEEFRDGEKIGESRRDFQMLVVDGCTDAEPPVIKGKNLNDTNFSFIDDMSVSFSNTVTDADRCIKVQISDPDSEKELDDFIEQVSIRAVSLNFNKNVSEVLPVDVSETLVNGSTAEFTICFPRCPYFEGGPYQIGIIAMDDACALPLLDTLKVLVDIEPPVNNEPFFLSSAQVIQQINEGDSVGWIFEASDVDLDSLFVGVTTNGFTLASAGMTFSILEQQDGYVKGALTWNAACDIYNFTERNYFEVDIFVEDVKECFNTKAIARYTLVVILPGNADPIIDTDLLANPLEQHVVLERRINQSLTFNVTGSDLVDNDFLILDVTPLGFTLEDHDISFEGKTGNSSLTSPFTWDIRCDNVDLDVRDEFDFRFIVVDNANKCRIYKADTVLVSLTVLPLLNAEPILTVSSLNQEVLVNESLTSFVGQPIELGVIGSDADNFPDKDLLTLELISADGNVQPVGYFFEDAEAEGNVTSVFTWNPECNIFQNDQYKNDYTFTFRLSDDRCFSMAADTLTVNITIEDYPHDSLYFDPSNVFTPNGDGFNDYFSMEVRNPQNGELINILPRDSCIGTFQAIRIYNRWGNRVFETTDRNFRWFAEGMPAGVYYFVIQYSNEEYKGSVSIRF